MFFKKPTFLKAKEWLPLLEAHDTIETQKNIKIGRLNRKLSVA